MRTNKYPSDVTDEQWHLIRPLFPKRRWHLAANVVIGRGACVGIGASVIEMFRLRFVEQM